jgi:hypothetical protein
LPVKVWEIPRAWGRLSRAILHQSQLTTAFLNTRHWGWAIALLSPDRIEQLALHAGAVALRGQVCSSVRREHVLDWKRHLGNDAYRFATTSASLVPAPSLTDFNFTGHSPAQIGYQILESAIECMPEPMYKRVQLKIPSTPDRNSIESTKARRIIISILDITEPTWCSSIAAAQR